LADALVYADHDNLGAVAERQPVADFNGLGALARFQDRAMSLRRDLGRVAADTAITDRYLNHLDTPVGRWRLARRRLRFFR
jgi:hypothetical protein